MAGKRSAAKSKKNMVKVGFTLTETTDYKLRNYAARRKLKPSMVIEQLLVERFRGEDLPASPPGSKEASQDRSDVE